MQGGNGAYGGETEDTCGIDCTCTTDDTEPTAVDCYTLDTCSCTCDEETIVDCPTNNQTECGCEV